MRKLTLLLNLLLCVTFLFASKPNSENTFSNDAQLQMINKINPMGAQAGAAEFETSPQSQKAAQKAQKFEQKMNSEKFQKRMAKMEELLKRKSEKMSKRSPEKANFSQTGKLLLIIGGAMFGLGLIMAVVGLVTFMPALLLIGWLFLALSSITLLLGLILGFVLD